jgi:5-methylthioribose kinase
MATAERPAGPLVELDETNISAYLHGRGLIDDPAGTWVRRLSGGYVNNVFRVESGAEVLILKQSLNAARRTVLEAPIGRALVEVAAMKAIRRLLGEAAPIPSIVDDDPENYVSVMTAAPNDAVVYDSELLAGRFHPGTGARLGLYAANLHTATEGSDEIARDFGLNPGFALRDQSIRSAGAANPTFGPLIEAALRRNREQACALVDADITPKNVLVHRAGITKLDFECAQWGDPAFDVGIIVAHFVLLGFARPRSRAELLAEARGCCEAYANARPEARYPGFVPGVFEYAGVMMLGRADGDLVFDYLVPHRQVLRALVGQLASGPGSVDDGLALVEAALCEIPG